MRQIILEVPDRVMCIGVFINYKSKGQSQEGNHDFTTTNCLINTAKYDGVNINEDGELAYIRKRGRQ